MYSRTLTIAWTILFYSILFLLLIIMIKSERFRSRKISLFLGSVCTAKPLLNHASAQSILLSFRFSE